MLDIILKYFERTQNYLYRKRFEKLKSANNLNIGKDVVFKKIPIIQLHQNAQLIIEDGVTINSDNYGYHVNMFAPVKFMADREGALIKIGENTRIHGTSIHSYKKIEIGKNCLIAANCQIIDSNGHDISGENVDNRINTFGTSKEVIIEDAVWLGTGVIVLPGVRIGKGSIISANSVVHIDIPPMVIAGGNPIQIIKEINNK